MNEQLQEQWGLACATLDHEDFPVFSPAMAGERGEGKEWERLAETREHTVDRTKHSTIIFRKIDDCLGFDLEWKVVFCPSCRELKTKTGALYGSKGWQGLAYIKEFYRA